MSHSSKAAALATLGLAVCYLAGYVAYRSENNALWTTSSKEESGMLVKLETREQRVLAKLFWPCIQSEDALQRLIEKLENWHSP